MSDLTEMLIDGAWVQGRGPVFASHNPIDGEVVWSGNSADCGQVHQAIAAAQRAFPAWADCSAEQRMEFMVGFVELLENRGAALAEAISMETGKPQWEALAEVAAMKAKLAMARKAYFARRAENRLALVDAAGCTRFRPHGVIAVLGPFNMPGHLPNGHIMPALLAGNTVVFKPSEYTPHVGRMMAEIWQEACLPAGVLNLIQGGRHVGQALGEAPELDGLFFTGGFRAGMALAKASLECPQRIVALEMGGNNPLVVWEVADIKSAAITTILSAFITAGQRCSCARRLIVPDGSGGAAILEELVRATASVRVGPYTLSPEPFMGPLITAAAAMRVLDAQGDMLTRGGLPLLAAQSQSPALLTPGIIDVTAQADRRDEEIFGPLLQVIRVPDFPAALAEAGNTRYGLSAAILTDRRDLYEEFLWHVKAGVINWNRPTTGASGELPFGGTGYSGNHRPAGYYSADYCDYPVASMESPTLTFSSIPPGIRS